MLFGQDNLGSVFPLMITQYYLHSESLVFLPPASPNFATPSRTNQFVLLQALCVIIFRGHACELSQATKTADKWAIYLIQ